MRSAAGFLGGQFGDLIIQTVAARAFKEQFPDAALTFAVAERYKDILPLFAEHPHIDSFHIWEGYDDMWPTPADREYMSFKRFDHVFNPMAPHSRPDWFNHRHYGEEACLRHGLRAPSDLSYELVKWFPRVAGCERYITLSLFPSKGGQLDKTMPLAECEALCVGLRALGYTPVQLGGRFEVKLENAVAPSFSILEAAQILTSSHLHITADTAFSSIAAGYHHPTLGFYGLNYRDMTDCWSHLPPNRNGHYIKNRPPQTVRADEVIAVAREQGLL